MKIKFLADAEAEFIASILFYEERINGLGIDFYREIRTAIEIIQSSPDVWPIKRYKCRRYLLKGFPFAIHYYIKEDIIWIVSVAHTSRKPFYWKERLKNV